MSDYWYPFYPAVFKADTMHLSAEQDGIYRRLIDHYMETRRPLPDSDDVLSRISGVSPECFKHASSIVRAFFKHENGALYHRFCDEQLDIQDKRSRKRSDIAQRAANKRWKENQQDKCIEHASSNSEAMLGDATGQDRTLQLLSKDNNKRPLKRALNKPDDVDEGVWQDFLIHRKAKKASVTQTVIDGFRREALKAQISLEDSLVVCMTQGWQGFKAEWFNKEKKNGKRTSKDELREFLEQGRY